MKRIKLWWRRIQCRIFNRHVYAYEDLQCHYDPLNMEYKFRNRCIHCGGEWRWKCPQEFLYGGRIRKTELEDEDDDE